MALRKMAAGPLRGTAMRVIAISRACALWKKLPDEWQHCIGALFVVLIFTLPIFLLALDHRCIQLAGHCN
jgi:hypothetical protein